MSGRACECERVIVGEREGVWERVSGRVCGRERMCG